MLDKTKKTLPSQSLARGLRVLEHIVFSRRAVRLKDVAEVFDMDMASAHRLLRTLSELGYIARLEIGKAYGPGPRLKEVAGSFEAIDRILEELTPIVSRLAEDSGQIAHVAILDGSRAVLTEVVSAKNAAVTVRQAVGDTDELYLSAVGKVLLANLPEYEQNALLRTIKFEQRTPNTLVSMAALRRELADVRDNQVAFDDCEGSLEVACIGAPILDTDGFAIAAIGISVPSATLGSSIRDCKDQTELVMEAAASATDVVKSQRRLLAAV